MTLVGSEQESLAQKAERKTNSELTSALCLVVGGNPGLADVRFFTQLGQVTIGRSAESDLILDGGTVSRVHCVLKRVSSGYLVEDHSRNGTWVNGIRIRSCLLRDGDQLRIGPHLLRVELATARPTIQEAVRGTGSASLLPLEPNLFDTEVRRHPQIFVRGLEEGVTLSLCGAETRIGRHPSNDIKLNGDKVSRDHSLIRRTDTGFILIDAGSANGTSVNGQRVDRADLSDGDLIRIGEFDCLVSFRGQDCLLQFRKRAN